MPVKDEQTVSAVVRLLESKLAAQRMVKAMLDGADLEFRALKYELAIVNPHARERGEIRVEYATGHVTWRRVVRDHWGPLQGYHDGSNMPCIEANKILTALDAGTPKSEPDA